VNPNAKLDIAGTLGQSYGNDTQTMLLHTKDFISDTVISGCLPATSATLISDISAGVAYSQGRRIVKIATSKTYTASKDTYVDLKGDGTYIFTEVVLAAAAPAIAADSIRLAKVVTDVDNITGVTDLRTVFGSAVTAAANIPDNALVRGDGGAKGVQLSTVLVSDAGEMTNPSQPAFQARPTAVQLDIAAGSDITIVFGTEIFDQGGDFASNTFTAPVGGRYMLIVDFDLRTLDTAATYYQGKIITSNRAYVQMFYANQFAADVSAFPFVISILADMDANDTAYATMRQEGGTAQADIQVNAHFTGHLVC